MMRRVGPWGIILLLVGSLWVPGITLLCPQSGDVAGPDLFDLTLRSDLVIYGRVVDGELKLAEIAILQKLRGQYEEEHLMVAFRHLNGTRRRWEKRLVFPNGEFVVLFLRRGRLPKSNLVVFEPVRRQYGKMTLPPEGTAGLLEAIRTFAAVADSPTGEHWERLRELLVDDNPLVVETVLKQFEKHHLATQKEATPLLRILRQAGDRQREQAARILGQLLSDIRNRGEQLIREKDVINLLITSARNDPSVAIRIWAVRTLQDWASPPAVKALELIAESDPSQDVRFEAERCLFELRNESMQSGS